MKVLIMERKVDRRRGIKNKTKSMKGVNEMQDIMKEATLNKRMEKNLIKDIRVMKSH